MKATVISSDGGDSSAPTISNIGPGDDSAAPRITQSDRDAVDSTLDAVLGGKGGGGDGGGEGDGGTPPAAGGTPPTPGKAIVVKPAEKTPAGRKMNTKVQTGQQGGEAPKTGSLSDANTGKPPTEPKKPEDAQPKPGEEQTPTAGQTPATPPPAKPQAQPGQQPAPGQQPQQDPEIDGIQKPKNLSPANDSNWETLRSLTKKYKQEAVQHKQIAEQLQKEVGKLPEPVEKELTTLRDMRRRFDLQNDPHFVENFDKPIQQRNTEICSILGQCGMKQEQIDEVTKRGGPMAMPDSWWENGKDGIIDRLRNSDNPEEKNAAIIVRNMLNQNVQALYERSREVQKAVEGKADWMTERIKKIDEERKNEANFYETNLRALQKDIPWAQEQQIPDGATAEQRAAIEAHNQFARDTEARVKLALNPQSPQQRMEVAVAAAMAFKFKTEIDELTARLTAANETINKLKGASVAPGKAAPSVKPTSGTSFGQLIKMKDSDAIEAGLQAAGI